MAANLATAISLAALSAAILYLLDHIDEVIE